jgi:hypothetical protein
MRRLAPGLLLAWSACCACGDGSGLDGGMDASLDGGRDAGLDGGRDAARDVGTRDTGTDAPRGPDAPLDPDWRPLDGLPSDCRLERALHPEMIPGEMVVEGCSLLPSCVRRRSPADEGRAVRATRTSDGALAVLSILDAAEQQRVVLWVEDTRAATWRGGRAVDASGLCLLGPGAVSRDSLGLVTQHGSGGTGTVGVRYSAISSPEMTDTPRTLLTGPMLGRRFIQGFLASDLALGGDLQPGSVPYVIDAATFTLHDLTPTVPEPGDIGGTPRLVGDRLFWTNFGAVNDVLTGSPTSPTAVLLAGVSNPEIHDFHATETDLAWYLGYDFDVPTLRFARLELWTSPYATDAASVMPRRVLELPTTDLLEYVLGEGIVVRRPAGGREIEFIDLADGRIRRLALPTGWVADDTLYVARDLVVLHAGSVADGAFVLQLDPREVPYE